MSHVPKLVIIRGPSAAGKSTVARAVFEASARPTAIVARDHYMLMFNTSRSDVPDKELFEQNTLFCLNRGFDVILEGNFKVETHGEALDRIFAAHPDENYVFYLDVSLEETLRRHRTRDQIISAEKMAELHPTATPLGLVDEIRIGESTSAADVVDIIFQTAGLGGSEGR